MVHVFRARRFCAEFSERGGELAGLVHNAGTMAPERTETDEGHELTLAVASLAGRTGKEGMDLKEPAPAALDVQG